MLNSDQWPLNYREAERERIEQYEKELEEMKQRVEKRPLLVERQSQVGSKYTTDQVLFSEYRYMYLCTCFHLMLLYSHIRSCHKMKLILISIVNAFQSFFGGISWGGGGGGDVNSYVEYKSLTCMYLCCNCCYF